MNTARLALAAGALLLPAALWAQASPKPVTPPGHAGHHPGAGPATAGPAGKDTMAGCQEMMAKHQKMMEDVKAMDARLDDLVTKMNAASDDHARIAATAAVVTEMAQQRRQMRDGMERMHQSMMGHMMGHMTAGGMKMECPMMKGMPPAAEKHP